MVSPHNGRGIHGAHRKCCRFDASPCDQSWVPEREVSVLGRLSRGQQGNPVETYFK